MSIDDLELAIIFRYEDIALWLKHRLPEITIDGEMYTFGYLLDVAVIFTDNNFEKPLSKEGIANTFKLYTSRFNTAVWALWRICVDEYAHNFDVEGFDAAILTMLKELEQESQ